MSTRCCVKIVKHFQNAYTEVKLYHHHDGYPEGVGEDLVNRSKNWAKVHPGDKWDIDDIVNSLIKDSNDEYEYTAYNHVDIEYLYTIDCDDMSIKCNKAHWRFKTNEKGETDSYSEIGEEVEIP